MAKAETESCGLKYNEIIKLADSLAELYHWAEEKDSDPERTKMAAATAKGIVPLIEKIDKSDCTMPPIGPPFGNNADLIQMTLIKAVESHNYEAVVRNTAELGIGVLQNLWRPTVKAKLQEAMEKRRPI